LELALQFLLQLRDRLDQIVLCDGNRRQKQNDSANPINGHATPPEENRRDYTLQCEMRVGVDGVIARRRQRILEAAENENRTPH